MLMKSSALSNVEDTEIIFQLSELLSQSFLHWHDDSLFCQFFHV